MRCGLAALVFLACATDPPRPPAGDDEPSDFEELPDDGKADGVPAVFDRHDLCTTDLFRAAAFLDAAAVQTFLESSPYDRRSFLADESVGGLAVSEALVAAALAEGVNPLLLLVRLQVEQGLVSKSVRPSQSHVDFALGCGCPDSGCDSDFRGLDRQLACAADSLDAGYARSEDGTGVWVAGKPRRSLDGLRITPAGHATASLYAYTPWVLEGRGGNWLVWNVTRRYLQHLHALGLLDPA